jgi:hypothetical protein
VPSSKKKRFSSEYTMLSILEYLCECSGNPCQQIQCCYKPPAIKQQRTDRINQIMDILEQSEYIKPIRTSSNAIFYQITGKGIEAYSEWIKDF